jgi:signal peptidase I
LSERKGCLIVGQRWPIVRHVRMGARVTGTAFCMLRTENTWPSRNSSKWRDRLTLKKETRQGHILVCVALWSAISFLLFSRFVLATVIIDGASMEPTFRSGDRCLLNRMAPLFGSIDRGDMVVLRDRGDNDFAIKRIVGLPQDEVEILGGKVYINGMPLDESYLAPLTHTWTPQGDGHYRLGSDSFFVLGDNREISEDSRYYGPISSKRLLGVIMN